MTMRPIPRAPATCLALLDRLSRYIDNELTSRQRRTIDVHCRDCTRCQRMIAGLQRTVALCQSEGDKTMSPRLRARARARIARLLGGQSRNG